MNMNQNGRIEKKRGRSGFWGKTKMEIGQNGRTEKEEMERGVCAEDRNGYGSKWENREKVRMERVKD